MSRRNRKKQQQALSNSPVAQDILAERVTVTRHYKASLQLEHNKLGNEKHFRQLILGAEKMEAGALREELAIAGLTLSMEEQQALSAVQKLLDESDYLGQDGNGTLKIPAVAYLRAYGLTPRIDKNGRNKGFPEAQKQRALQALRELAETIVTLYFRKYKQVGKQRQYKAIRFTGSLIRLTEGAEAENEWHTDEEWSAFLDMEEDEQVTRYIKWLTIEPAEILFSGIPRVGSNESPFYVLKSYTLEEEVKEWYRQYRGQKRATRYPQQAYLFIGSYLTTLNNRKHTIRKSTLIERLKLEDMRRDRGAKAMEQRLSECLQCAQELGYLEKWEENYVGISSELEYTFYLNPEKLPRAGMKEKK